MESVPNHNYWVCLCMRSEAFSLAKAGYIKIALSLCSVVSFSTVRFRYYVTRPPDIETFDVIPDPAIITAGFHSVRRARKWTLIPVLC